MNRRIGTLEREIRPSPAVRGGVLANTKRIIAVSSSVTKMFNTGGIALSDFGDFNNNSTTIQKIIVTFPPLIGGFITFIPSAISPFKSFDSDRVVIAQHTKQRIVLDLPDAHMEPVTTTQETLKVLDLTVNSGAFAYVTVKYRTSITVSI